MWEKIEKFSNKHKMIEKGDRVLLGLSGGADSILLARYLITLLQRQEISLHAVHVNHQLRGAEALRDEAFVRVFCDRWMIPCHTHTHTHTHTHPDLPLGKEQASRSANPSPC